MEQQTVSIAKAGVLCSLPARTCVLAAANPVGGHYDSSRTVSENIKIKPALLSRFDLVYIILDKPNEHLDKLLTNHIQALHSVNVISNKVSQEPSDNKIQTISNTNKINKDYIPLYERIKQKHNEQSNNLPHVLMQKYIGYARKNINPTLTSEAAAELKTFYLNIRKVVHGIDYIPATIRQLEALIRLTQARARAELSTIATLEHAKDVLQILKYSMVDVLSSDVGTLKMKRNVNGAGISQASQVYSCINLQRL